MISPIGMSSAVTNSSPCVSLRVLIELPMRQVRLMRLSMLVSCVLVSKFLAVEALEGFGEGLRFFRGWIASAYGKVKAVHADRLAQPLLAKRGVRDASKCISHRAAVLGEALEHPDLTEQWLSVVGHAGCCSGWLVQARTFSTVAPYCPSILAISPIAIPVLASLRLSAMSSGSVFTTLARAAR